MDAGTTAGAIGDAVVTGTTLGDVTNGPPAAVGIKAVLAGQSLADGAKAVTEQVEQQQQKEEKKN